MRKKFTMLLASLLACVGVMKAAVTDLPQMTTSTEDIKWYAIMNTRSGKYANYAGDAVQMTQESAMSVNSLFYFTAVDGEVAEGFTAVKIHAFMTEGLLSHYNSWTAEGVTWYLHEDTNSETPAGLHITKAADLTGWNALNDASQTKITDYYSQDEGSIFVVESVEAATLPELASAYLASLKDAAKAELNNLALVSVIYPAATTAVEAVEAVTAASNSSADLSAAAAEIESIVTNYRNAAYQALEGKYFTTQTLTDRSKGFMQMSTSNVVGSETAESPANLWQFVCNGNGTVNVYNPYTGKYLCEPQSNSTEVAVTTDKANAGAYVLNVNATPSVAEAKVKLTSNGKSVHMDAGFTLVRWDDGGASEWQVAEITDFSSIIDLYKAASITTLDSWATLSVVFDAELIATAKTAINAINTTDYATFAAIDAELKNVTDKVAEKYFTFKNTDTATNARVDAYLAANASTNKGYGTKTFDYSAIWRLLSAGGTSFYLYNELNNVYLKNPGSGDLVADAAQAATYTFEIVDAATNKAELKSGSETLHLSNECALMSYDNDDAASRWIIATYDYKADLTALIAENENNHEEIPSLGKYPTAAYNALVEAGNTATTVQAVAEAIAAFKASLNRPVYFITSEMGEGTYAGGKAILYNGSAWRFDVADIYNRQMWMTIPGYTEENVPTVDSYSAEGATYEICDYLTGTVMRGKKVQIVKIENWDGVYNLQYGTATNDAVQHAQNGGALVGWNPATTTDCKASAWSVEYIGNSYDLDKLTDAHITALVGLQSAYDAKAYAADAEVGEGLGQYQGDKDAIVTALNAGKVILDMSLAEQAALDVDAINAAAEALKNASDLTLNMPVQGKFYRIKSVNSGNYVTAPANTGAAMTLVADASANSILYWDAEGHLLVYGTGYYINGKNHAIYGYKDTYAVEGSKTGVAGAYAIKPSTANYWHDNGANLDVYQNGTHANCNWTIEEVTTLPVAVSTVGYATLHAPVALTIPAGVKAYTGTLNGEWLTLNEVSTTIPANTAVILEATEKPAEATTFNFTVTTNVAEIDGNDLVGTIETVAKTGTPYTLQSYNDGVAFKQYTGEYLTGFKAYLVVEGNAQAIRVTRGDEEGTTSIDNAQLTIDNVVIYDLQGRRVEKMEKGIYIVNGKKVIR